MLQVQRSLAAQWKWLDQNAQYLRLERSVTIHFIACLNQAGAASLTVLVVVSVEALEDRFAAAMTFGSYNIREDI